MPPIMQDELHIWWANLRDFDSDAHALRSVLSPSEQARAEKFRFLHDKNNYLIAHGILRVLLASYVGQRPSDLDFTTGTYGKPELQRCSAGPDIHFNLSHSGDLALYGVTRLCPIGVDVERLRPMSYLEQIAEHCFSQRQVESLMGLPAEQQEKHFFTFWTCKEALLKGTGEGLSHSRNPRDTDLADLEIPQFTEESRFIACPGGWNVHSFLPTPGYVAAVAVRMPRLRFACRNIGVLFSGALSGCP